MIKISKTPACTSQIVDAASSLRRTDFEVYMSDNVANIQAAADCYRVVAERQGLLQIQPHVDTDLSTKENFRATYTNELSSATGAARKYYDLIRGSAPFNLCPYCGMGVVDQVDHFLPKAKFHEYALTCYNLVPICGRCNRKKGAKFGRTQAGQYLHPYFDEVRGTWLSCKIHFKPRPRVVFSVLSDEVGEVTAARLRKHVSDLGINEAFRVNAASYLSSMREEFVTVLRKRGHVALRTHINGMAVQAECEARTKNYWKYALLSSLKDCSDAQVGSKLCNIPKPLDHSRWEFS